MALVQKAFFDAFENDESTNLEMVQGEQWLSPRPAPLHAWAASQLMMSFGNAFGSGASGGSGGWIILMEPELHLGPDILIPDIAGWRIEHLPELPDTAYFSTAPDWVCEIISPSSVARDRAKKMPVYANYHVSHVWLLDPLAQTLEVFRLHNQNYLLLETQTGQAHVQAEPFTDLSIQLSLLWPQRKGTVPA